MAIQDLINEVNSIQTKKQAIKEAITAKGVTSEGKLSKFADEIKQISTGEPYWCVLNRYRLDNGKEGVCARTNLDGIIDSVAASNSQNQLLEIYPDGYIRTMNGSAFSKKEQACCFIEPFNPRSNDGFNNIDNTYKISDTYAADKTFTVTDFKSYNQYLRPYKENVLVNHNAVYISTTCKDGPRFSDITDKLDANNGSLMFYPNGNSEPIEYVTKIDSTTFIQMAKSEDFSKVGFIKIGNESPVYINLRCERIFGKKRNGRDYSRLLSKIYNDTTRYDSLPFGNYMWLSGKEGILVAVFVGINYIVDINGNKKKNIEIYPYTIFDTRDSNINSYRNGDAIELYLNVSEQGQKAIKDATSIKSFRRQVLAANGTPEALPMYLNGLDMLGRFTSVRGKYANNRGMDSLFSRKSGVNSVEHQNVRYGDGPFRSMYITKQLGDAIKANSPIKAFIRLNNDTNNMAFIELEEMPSDGKFTFYCDYGYGLAVFQKGINNDNRVIAVFIDEFDRDKCKIYRLKKAGTSQYITNDIFGTTEIDNHIFITANQPTIEYLNKTPLSKVWTEIQNVLAHKEDYEAYTEY